MPRNVDPGTIRVGKGLAPEGTVEDNSLRYPERDADPLRVHIHDPSRAHMASSIGIVDELDCYVSDEVEGALQELCGNSAAGRLNGLIAGGTFSELGCLPNGTAGGVHATLTLCSPTEILMNGTVLDATGLTVSVPAANTVYFIYLDTQVSSPTYRELVATTGTPPQVEVGDPDTTTGPGSIENVMLAKVTMDAGGNVVSWQDARFFVRNLDRKVTYSSRQGENVDAWSEGCFANLQAFFFWAEYYGDGALPSSNEEEKGMVLIRGKHTILSTLNVPTDHLQFVGDGEAIIELTGNAAFDGVMVDDKKDITFRNITFLCNVASTGSKGIRSAGDFTDLTVEDCRFLSGTQNFSTALHLDAGGASNERITVRDCAIEAVDCGVNVDGFGSTSSWGALIENCSVDAQAVAVGSVGIQLGDNQTNGYGTVRGCFVSSFEVGIMVKDTGVTLIEGNTIRDTLSGIIYPSDSAVGHTVANNHITLGDNLTLHGIFFGIGHQSIVISGNYIRSLIDGGHPSEPYGISVQGRTASEKVNARIENNHVIGFYDATATIGHGIWVVGTDGVCEGVTITGNTLSRNNIAVESWMNGTITGNTVEANTPGMPPGPTVGGAIDLTNARSFTVSGNTVNARDVIRHGVYARVGKDLTVTGNTVTQPFVTGVLLDSGPNFGAIAGMENFTVSGNTVDALPDPANPSLPTADGIVISSTTDDGSPEIGVVDGNSVRRCRHGILLTGFAINVPIRDVTVSNNIVSECAKDQDTWDIFDFQDAGTYGIGCLYAKNIILSGNNIGSVGQVTLDTGAPLVPANNVFVQALFALNCSGVTAQGNTIRNSLPYGTGRANDIALLVGRLPSNVECINTKVEGNSIIINDSVDPGSHQGILAWADGTPAAATASFLDLSISDNTIHTVNGASGSGVGTGIHIVAQDEGAIEGARIEGNQVGNYLSTGIYVQTGDASPQGDSSMYRVGVRHNTLRSMGAAGPTAAIYVTAFTDDDHIKRIYMLTIEGNTISNSWGQGIYFTCAASDTTTTGLIGMDAITVADNEIDRLLWNQAQGAVGIGFVLDGGTNERMNTGYPAFTTPGLQNFSVLRNRISQVGRGFDLGGDDILSWANFTIEDNNWSGNGSAHLTPTTDYLNRVALTLSDNAKEMTLENWSISGNNCAIDPQNRQLDNWQFLTENANVSVLRVQGNQINGSGLDASPNDHGRAFYYLGNNQKNGLVSTDHKEIHISGNTFGGGLYWEARNSSLYRMDIHGNQISVPAADADTPTLSPLVLWNNGYDVDGLNLQTVHVRENALTGGTHSLLFMVDDTQEIEEIAICGNAFQDARLHAVWFGVDQSSGVSYHSDVVRNLLIDGNIIGNHGANSTNQATGIRFAAGQAATQTLGITNNQVYNQDLQAITCFFGGSVPAFGGAYDRNITIEDNKIDLCGYTDAALPLISLEVDPAASLGANDDISSVSVSGNQISNCGWSDGSVGIYADFADYGICYDMRVDDNTLTQPSGSIINPSRFGSGVELDLPSAQRLSVSRNQLRCSGFAGGVTKGFGIFLQFYRGVDPGSTEPGISGIALDDNIISLDDDSDGGINWAVLATEDMQIRDFSVCRNQIRARTANIVSTGIRFVGEDGAGDYSGYLQNLHINDNLISNLRTAVELRQSELDMLHDGLLLRNCGMDGNNVYECSIQGLVWKTGDVNANSGNIHGFSASRNQVTTTRRGDQSVAANPLLGVFFGRGLLSGTGSVNMHSISVDENQIYLANPDDQGTEWTGIHLRLSAVNNDGGGPVPSGMTTISCDRNHIRNTGYNAIDFEMLGYTEQNAQGDLTNVTKVKNASCSGNLIIGGTEMVTSVHRGLLRIDLENAVLQQFTLQGNNVETVFVDGLGEALVVATNYLPPNPPVNNNDDNQYWSVQSNVITHAQDGNEHVIAVMDAGGATGWHYGPPVQGIVTGNLNTSDTNANDDFNGAYWAFGGTSIQSNNLVIP